MRSWHSWNGDYPRVEGVVRLPMQRVEQIAMLKVEQKAKLMVAVPARPV